MTSPARQLEVQLEVPGRVASAPRLDDSYARELTGLYAPQAPVPVEAPRLVAANHELAGELGIDPGWLRSPSGLAVLAGNEVPAGTTPIAQAYAGHQFGAFNPQLGDGRAVLLGEIVTPAGERRDLALKGSGRTPFSRGGDGRAALGPVLREYLMGEAMHALAIPTTRALAAVATGERVVRDRALPGAVIARTAASHLRVGTFQFVGARGRHDDLGRLVRYAIARHDPDLEGDPRPALTLLDRVADRQASLVAQWMHVGFVHGVMNTDNTTISGETIDFGPCAFLDAYDPGACFSSIDHDGRYAYGNQPAIARWNLARLAEALIPLIDPDVDRAVGLATEVIDEFPARFEHHWLAGLRRKLGLTTERDDDRRLAVDWLELLRTAGADLTLAWRWLGDDGRLRDVLASGTGDRGAAGLDEWLARWRARLDVDGAGASTLTDRLEAANPVVIPRNHLVEHALSAAVDDDDLAPFERLLDAVRRPFDEPDRPELAEPAPPAFTAAYRTYCGT